MTVATVLIPTHDHGPTLVRALASALEQSVRDIEIFVVGDGVPDMTRTIMAEAVARDRRVRFFDRPKGYRHGETHRHEALADARGRIVCYLADDDLWLPDHVETMDALLSDSDFAHTLPVRVDGDGRVCAAPCDLSIEAYRRLHMGGRNRIPLATAGHTLDAYRQLSSGWQPAPPEVYSDLFMWQRFISSPWCRMASGKRATVLHFPSVQRADWPIDRRCSELDRWLARIRDPAWRRDFVPDAVEG
jgi:glycosyltransferase involved in cell wall biosynthesis